MTLRQSYGLINPNKFSYVYVVGMQSKCKYLYKLQMKLRNESPTAFISPFGCLFLRLC